MKLIESNGNIHYVIATRINELGETDYLCDDFRLYFDKKDDFKIRGELVNQYKNKSMYFGESTESVVDAEDLLIDINLFMYLIFGNITGDEAYEVEQQYKMKQLNQHLSEIKNQIERKDIELLLQNKETSKWESTAFGKQIIDLGNNSYYIDDPVYDIFFKKDEQGSNVDIEVINK